jgi:hypothetical protein
MSQLNNFAQIRASESVTLVVPFIGIPKARLFCFQERTMHELEKDIETLVLATLEEHDIQADYQQDNRSAMQALVHLVDKGLVETYCREGRTHFRLAVGMPE